MAAHPEGSNPGAGTSALRPLPWAVAVGCPRHQLPRARLRDLFAVIIQSCMTESLTPFYRVGNGGLRSLPKVMQLPRVRAGIQTGYSRISVFNQRL